MNTYEVRISVRANSKEEAVEKAIDLGCESKYVFVTDTADSSGTETRFLLKDIFNG